MTQKIWFIIAASLGFGREWAITALGIANADYEQRLATWEKWQDVTELAQG